MYQSTGWKCVDDFDRSLVRSASTPVLAKRSKARGMEPRGRVAKGWAGKDKMLKSPIYRYMILCSGRARSRGKGCAPGTFQYKSVRNPMGNDIQWSTIFREIGCTLQHHGKLLTEAPS